MGNYTLTQTGAQIQQILNKVQSPDSSPTSGSSNLVTSGGVYAAIQTLKNAGFFYVDVATPTTNPGTPTQKVAYIATTPGTYTNFGGLVVNDGEVAILKYNGSWSKDVTGAATKSEVAALGGEVVLGWILAEAFTLSSATRNADGNVTTANVVWPDTKTGSLTITRDSNGNATKIVATHDGVTHTLNITRDADGNATSSTIS